mmetsp:Transcript_28179/g.27021  ORF Transcript_28179/g.27021 Transcript_28179/m.27021 type:complete len:209 (+) Transcript_28179:207-833(+)
MLVPPHEIALAFAGKLEVPIAFTHYLNSKQIYQPQNKDTLDLKSKADREATIKDTFFDRNNRAVWIQPRASFKKIWLESSEIHTYIGSRLQQNDAEWLQVTLDENAKLVEEQNRFYDVFAEALILYACRLGWVVKFDYSPEIYYREYDDETPCSLEAFKDRPSRMCFVLIEGKAVATAMSVGKKYAKERVCFFCVARTYRDRSGASTS